MTSQQLSTKRASRGADVGFWALAVAAIPTTLVAWGWNGFVQLEAQTEQCKALAAGTSMDSFGLLVGVAPLLFTYAALLVGLVIVGRLAYGTKGIVLATGVLLVVSIISVLLLQGFTGGELLTYGAGNADCILP